jgi:hypothetical protein
VPAQQGRRPAKGDAKTAGAHLKTVIAELKSIADGIDKQLGFLADLPKAPSGVSV